MIEHKQLYYHKPDTEGTIGDCFRTCIACVLNLSAPDDVPHVFELALTGKPDTSLVTPEAHTLLNEWLKSQGTGLVFHEFPLQASLEQLRVYINHYLPNQHVLIGCNSDNGGHSVVMKGLDYIWDPSRDNSGCVGPMDDGYFWLGLLVKDTSI